MKNCLTTKCYCAIILSTCNRIFFLGSIYNFFLLQRVTSFFPSFNTYSPPKLNTFAFRKNGEIGRNIYEIDRNILINESPVALHSYPLKSHLPAPPDPLENENDNFTRELRSTWPVWLQHFLRDFGVLRTIVDTLTILSIPSLVRENPHMLLDYLELTNFKDLSTWIQLNIEYFRDKKELNDGVDDFLPNVKYSVLRYGSHKSQYIDFIEPDSEDYLDSSSSKRLVAFVHGGAWGSGAPWMYRLVSKPFLTRGYSVAIIGYRTYPDTDIYGQIRDVKNSLNHLSTVYRTHDSRINVNNECSNDRHTHKDIDMIVGHSSGAHIASLLMLGNDNDNFLSQREEGLAVEIRNFIGISGVYCIPSHYHFESLRGVDQISPMLPAHRYTIQKNKYDQNLRPPAEHELYPNSPIFQLNEVVNNYNNTEKLNITSATRIPSKFLFVHGLNDTTVPYTQTYHMGAFMKAYQNQMTISKTFEGGEDKNALKRNCNITLLSDVEHVDTIFHIMTRGKTRDAVMNWIDKL